MYFLFIIFLGINLIYSLNPSKLPNGNLKKYVANKNYPYKDLREITSGKATLVTKNWLENIVNNILANEIVTLNFFRENEDMYIITKIMNLEKKIKENKDNICLAWMPKCIYGSDDVLSIILIEYEEENIIDICEIVPSPFWISEQIESIELKKSLVNLGELKNISVNFNKLFEHDKRYQLAWSTWDLDKKN